MNEIKINPPTPQELQAAHDSFMSYLRNNPNNLKTKSLVLIAVTLMCVSCSWEDYTGPSKQKKAYLQVYSESQDSTNIDNNDNDSIYAAHTMNMIVVDSTTATPTRTDSVRCGIHVDGRLGVDGGISSDISDTFVTVEKIIVSVQTDGKEMVTYYPQAKHEVAEPLEVFGWETMPEGVNYARKRLTDAPVTIFYMDHCYVEVTVCYILRVRDTKLAVESTADRYWNTVRCESSSYRENKMDILVPLELTTIQFDAIVEQTDTQPIWMN